VLIALVGGLEVSFCILKILDGDPRLNTIDQFLINNFEFCFPSGIFYFDHQKPGFDSRSRFTKVLWIQNTAVGRLRPAYFIL
jgi:hypothetical protein